MTVLDSGLFWGRSVLGAESFLLQQLAWGFGARKMALGITAEAAEFREEETKCRACVQ